MNRHFSSVTFIPLEPNRTLQDGRLKVLRQLSFGGFSAVYLAQTGVGEKVVIKESVIPTNQKTASWSDAERMLEKEAHLLMQLSHPQIVKARDFFVENGKVYLVLDYLPGENLRQIVHQKGPRRESQVIHWAHQLAEVIAYLHAQNPPIIHRDISPDNIIIGAEGKLVLIDFGASNEFITTATGTCVGKQAYVPPEQFKGKATLASDIYALGATLYFVLTGSDPEALSQSHPQIVKPAVSKPMDEFIAACTCLELNERIRTAEEVLSRLSKVSLPIEFAEEKVR
jgi:eukaryotic-like serine/threonine-protein kinase